MIETKSKRYTERWKEKRRRNKEMRRKRDKRKRARDRDMQGEKGETEIQRK